VYPLYIKIITLLYTLLFCLCYSDLVEKHVLSETCLYQKPICQKPVFIRNQSLSETCCYYKRVIIINMSY